jgi:hypothetical protein
MNNAFALTAFDKPGNCEINRPRLRMKYYQFISNLSLVLF